MRSSLFWLTAAVISLAACSPKQASTGSPQSSDRPPKVNDPADTNGIAYLVRWQQRTLLTDYENHGRRSSKWDAPARAALHAMAEVRALTNVPGPEVTQRLQSNANAAVALGCDDALIRYLHVRFGLDTNNADAPAVMRAYVSVADDMHTSNYHPLRKFYAAQRASSALTYVARNLPGEPITEVNYPNMAHEHLLALVNDPSVPPKEAYEAVHEFVSSWEGDRNIVEQAYKSLEEPFIENWGWHYLAQYQHGDFYIGNAWLARGKGLANTVTSEGWKVMKERLAVAGKALETSWRLYPKDSRAAEAMIRVELGQGQGRQRMELWYQRALAADPLSYAARHNKTYYLTPQWYGSQQEALAFARECAQITNGAWGLELMVPEAHNLIVTAMSLERRAVHWQQPGIWPEMRDAYEAFFQRHPDAVGWRHNYARHAWWCQQWDDLNRQIPLLGPHINHAFFGGKAKFEQMLMEAKAHLPAAPP